MNLPPTPPRALRHGRRARPLLALALPLAGLILLSGFLGVWPAPWQPTTWVTMTFTDTGDCLAEVRGGLRVVGNETTQGTAIMADPGVIQCALERLEGGRTIWVYLAPQATTPGFATGAIAVQSAWPRTAHLGPPPVPLAAYTSALRPMSGASAHTGTGTVEARTGRDGLVRPVGQVRLGFRLHFTLH